MGQSGILERIVSWKREEIADRKRRCPPEVVQAGAAAASPPRDFAAALRAPGLSLIAEIKRASPSKGMLAPHLDAPALARRYETSGAAALSVLTDEHFFCGSLEDLRIVRQSVTIPVLRKDFILDPYQVYEARAAGADAVLLIVAALDDVALRELHELACALGMAALVEVHNTSELERALRCGPRIVGINNRDLDTFEVHLDTTERLRPLIPPDILVVAESGIHSRADVARLRAIGVDGILVGEALVRAADVRAKVEELLG
ncbi:MAG: indole-3-glycerol phosphate synthase TrpC [Anaerolineae bacterium]|nr:indole-3-glycerol phosphate synthase TrpC [Anaerolineae bacterium]